MQYITNSKGLNTFCNALRPFYYFKTIKNRVIANLRNYKIIGYFQFIAYICLGLKGVTKRGRHPNESLLDVQNIAAFAFIWRRAALRQGTLLYVRLRCPCSTWHLPKQPLNLLSLTGNWKMEQLHPFGPLAYC